MKRPVVKSSPYSKLSGVPIHVYSGHKTSQAKNSRKSSAQRAPASINAAKSIKLNPQIEINQSSTFENSLLNQYKHQMRHETEVNRLIEDLRNYDQDYQTGY